MIPRVQESKNPGPRKQSCSLVLRHGSLSVVSPPSIHEPSLASVEKESESQSKAMPRCSLFRDQFESRFVALSLTVQFQTCRLFKDPSPTHGKANDQVSQGTLRKSWIFPIQSEAPPPPEDENNDVRMRIIMLKSATPPQQLICQFLALPLPQSGPTMSISLGQWRYVRIHLFLAHAVATSSSNMASGI